MVTPSGDLRDVQRWLADVILASDAERDASGTLIRPPRGSTTERLHAYVDGYPARLREALLETFPAVAHLVGASEFGDLVRRYLPVVPIGGYNLSDVGAALAAFLEDDALGAELPLLSDLARLEWAVQRAFHATLLPPFDPATVAGWTADVWAEARIRFQAGTACVASAWPIRTLWAARTTPREEIDLVVQGRPEHVVVHRVEYRVACDVVGAAEAAVLGRLLGGATLGTAVADLASDDAERLGEWTASWVARGLVVACDPPHS